MIFYVWGDDHIRSLLRCRHAIIYRVWDDRGGRMFHNNFWPNLQLDLETGAFVEKENPLATTTALYRMSDPDWMAAQLRDDWALQLFACKRGYISELDREPIGKLAARLDFPWDWSRETPPAAQAAELLDRYSLRATQFVLEKAREFARQHAKKLLVVLFDPYRAMSELQQGRPRYDQEIVDWLKREKFRCFDMNEAHLRDFQKYRVSFEDYRRQYFVGHYNPRGNHLFAYAIKDTVVEWLDPKPVTYRRLDPATMDLKNYLPECR